jgi:hypothetical protein
MSVTWTLLDASGNPLTNQPASGSPLALKFTSNGDAHLSGYTSQLIHTVEGTTDTSPVAIELTPDSSGDSLAETRSNPTELPSAHGGSLTWVDGSSGLTTLTFTVPTVDEVYEWGFGEDEPPVALRMRVRLRRT